jgi:NMD protein affecting ribosome stability and mRNA decay
VRLAAVRPGDIVRAGDLHAVVVAKVGRSLVVRGLCNGSTRRLRADEVDAHWRARVVRERAGRPT